LSTLLPTIEQIFMDILPCLPEAVIADILTSWLELGDVAQLDSAVCCRATRPALLALLYSPMTVHKTSDLLEDFSLRTADQFSSWLFSRKAFVDGILVTSKFVQAQEQRDLYLQHCGESITCIHFGEESEVSEHLASICMRCISVKEMVCYDQLALSDYQIIVHAWPRLRGITAYSLVCNESLLVIAHACRELEVVDILTDSGGASDRACAAFINAAPPTLQRLIVRRQVDFLPSVNLYQCVCDAYLPCIQEVSFANTGITDTVLLAIAQRCALQYLCLSGQDSARGEGLMAALQYCKLRELSLHEIAGLGEACLTAVLTSVSCSLQKLELKGSVAVVNAALQTVGKCCTNLRELRLTYRRATIFREEARDVDWQHVHLGCPLLVTLQVTDCRVTDHGMCTIAEGCRSLQCLRIRGVGNTVTDHGMCSLAAHCTNLRLVSLALKRVTDKGLIALVERCKRLSSFALFGVPCTDASLHALAVHSRELRHLDVSFASGVTDVGVQQVAFHCKKLRYVCLAHLSITNNSAIFLATHCALLRTVSIHPRRFHRTD
jgi:hypothetical protein